MHGISSSLSAARALHIFPHEIWSLESWHLTNYWLQHITLKTTGRYGKVLSLQSHINNRGTFLIKFIIFKQINFFGDSYSTHFSFMEIKSKIDNIWFPSYHLLLVKRNYSSLAFLNLTHFRLVILSRIMLSLSSKKSPISLTDFNHSELNCLIIK